MFDHAAIVPVLHPAWPRVCSTHMEPSPAGSNQFTRSCPEIHHESVY